MEESNNRGMTLIVKTVTRLTVGLILLFGIYIVLHGHHTPGGGFAGGVIVALSFVNLMIAFGKETALKKITILKKTNLEIFIGIALIIFVGGYFLYHFITGSNIFNWIHAEMATLYNIAICMNVGAGLFVVLLTIVLFKIKRN